MDTLTTDLKQAMRDRDKVKLSTLRLLITDIKNTAVEQRVDASELSDEKIVETVSRQLKRRVEAAKEYRNAGRDDLAESEETEAKILEAYMPPQMGEDEVRAIVKEVVGSVGAQGPGDMGKVMGQVMPRVKGKADGSMVNRVVKEELA